MPPEIIYKLKIYARLIATKPFAFYGHSNIPDSPGKTLDLKLPLYLWWDKVNIWIGVN